jgi:hypothetical protein
MAETTRPAKVVAASDRARRTSAALSATRHSVPRSTFQLGGASADVFAMLATRPPGARKAAMDELSRQLGNHVVARALIQRGPTKGGGGDPPPPKPVPYPGKLETKRVVDEGGRHIRIGEWAKEDVPNPQPGQLPTETEMFWVDFSVDEKGVLTASARTVEETGRYRSPNLRLKTEFVKAEQAFKKSGFKVDEFEGDWSYMTATEPSTNLRIYKEQLAKGATPEEAALQTPSGKVAVEAGFTEVRVKSVTMEKLEHIGGNELYERVRVSFTRPVSGPGGSKPGEGPAGVPPKTAPPTTTTTGARVTAVATLAVIGANIALNAIIESRNESRIRDELKAKEPLMLKEQAEHPTLGFLLIFRFSGGADSLEGPTASARFEGLGWQRAYTESEGMTAWKSAPRVKARDESYVFGWREPLTPPSPEVLETPFLKVALAKFADIRKIEFQRVQFKEWGGFDTDGRDGPVDASKWADDAEEYRFLVLRMPAEVTYRNVANRLEKKTITVKDQAVVGGVAPALMLDDTVPAITVWPADDRTADLFAHTHEVGDKEGKLLPLANVNLVRWLKPEQVKLLSKL